MNRVRRLLEALGPAGVIGIGVFLFCIAFHESAIRPAERDLADLRHAAERGASPAAGSVADASRAAEFRRFYGLFPGVDQLPAELERLYGLARATGVEILRADYRLEELGAPLSAYRVTLPLRAPYARVREFIGSVLQSMPIAAIDALRFERRNGEDSDIDAQLRLTVYFRSATEDSPR